MSKQIQNKKAGLYYRLSQEDERAGESLSIENQKKILEKYARENGFEIIDEYIDDGWSGTNFNRPGVQRLLEDAKNGMSQEQLAEKYQICVSTVRYSLKDFYKEQARQRKAKKKAWQTQMIHEYEMGAKSPELQEKYGISGTLFYRILHEHGKNGRQIHSQNRIETGKKRNAEMVRKYKNGVSVKELAEEYGLKKGSVYRAMKRYNPGPGKNKSCQSEE